MQFKKCGTVTIAAVAAALMATPVLAAPKGSGGRMGGGAHFSSGARSFSSAGPSFRASSGPSQQFASVRSGGNWSGRDWSRHRRHGFGGFGAGFAAGALIGSAPYYYGYSDPNYYDDYAYDDGYYGDTYAAAPTYGGGDAQSCAMQYRSYDPASGTYLGYDGLRHPCP